MRTISACVALLLCALSLVSAAPSKSKDKDDYVALRISIRVAGQFSGSFTHPVTRASLGHRPVPDVVPSKGLQHEPFRVARPEYGKSLGGAAWFGGLFWQGRGIRHFIIYLACGRWDRYDGAGRPGQIICSRSWHRSVPPP